MGHPRPDTESEPKASGRIRAVFFDFDGVLTRDKTGSLTTLRYLGEATGIAYPRLREVFKAHNEALTLGTTTHDAIWPAICEALGCCIDKALLRPAFESTPFNTEMLLLARSLRQRCRVGIITDNKQDRIDHLRRFASLDAVFDPIVVSAEIGASKAGTLIFEWALQGLGIAPGESVFIDNSEDNLAAPRRLGMHAIHFDDEANDVGALIAVLGSLGLAV